MIDPSTLGHPWRLPCESGSITVPETGRYVVDYNDGDFSVFELEAGTELTGTKYHRIRRIDTSEPTTWIERSAARVWDVQPDADFIALGVHGRVICSGHADLWRGLSEHEVAAWAHFDELIDATCARAPQPVAPTTNSASASSSLGDVPQPSSRPAMEAEEAADAFRKAQCDWVDNDDDLRNIADVRRDWFRDHWPVGGAVDVEAAVREIVFQLDLSNGSYIDAVRDAIKKHLTDAPRVTGERLYRTVAAIAEPNLFSGEWEPMSERAKERWDRAAERLSGGAP